jgi:hypothetical protein
MSTITFTYDSDFLTSKQRKYADERKPNFIHYINKHGFRKEGTTYKEGLSMYRYISKLRGDFSKEIEDDYIRKIHSQKVNKKRKYGRKYKNDWKH